MEHACAPRSVTDMESELPGFRVTTEDWQSLVHRALTAGIPAPRIAQRAGPGPLDVVQAVGDGPWASHLSPPGAPALAGPGPVIRGRCSRTGRRGPAAAG
ncbi:MULTISPECIES: DUF6003 family protein [unclassified Streptomyces]|uniref:DUF6003 family protein n=1 Tax=unclassified Streptomyces TaxID=2593676 RepID=UPI00210AAD4B|nr:MULTISPECIES: DUF6003 family protein [unclassified Streptomyces]